MRVENNLDRWPKSTGAEVLLTVLFPQEARQPRIFNSLIISIT